MSAFERFVGIPYADKGRGEAVDCWGLVTKVFWELRGIELPSFADAYVTAHDRRAVADVIAGRLGPWREIAAGDEAPFDGVLMRQGAQPRHIGLVVRPGFMLHVFEGETSVIERYHEGRLARRVVGFYRYETFGSRRGYR